MTNTEATKNKRGRPKGMKMPPRPQSYVCTGIVNGECVSEFISPPTDHSKPDQFTSEEAEAKFEEMFCVSPAHTIGPLRMVGSAKAPINSKRVPADLKLDLTKMNLREARAATYNGWEGKAFLIENRPDVVAFVGVTEISPGAKKRTPPVLRPTFTKDVTFTDVTTPES